jgi:hypothetical protein
MSEFEFKNDPITGLNYPNNVDTTYWKFQEDKTINELINYISSTYKSHYAATKKSVQAVELIASIGDGVPFCKGNVIKYASRFGKKNGFSKLDALKTLHYGVLMYHFAELHSQKDSN